MSSPSSIRPPPASRTPKGKRPPTLTIERRLVEEDVNSSPIFDSTTALESSDDIVNDLLALERLRQSVHQNLKLRPLKSSVKTALPISTNDLWYGLPEDSVASPSSATSSNRTSVYFTPTSDSPISAYFDLTSSTEISFPDLNPSPTSTSPHNPLPCHHSSLHSILSNEPHPILIDTRPLNAFLLSHLRHSVNMAIPSLILKRCRKPGAGFQSTDSLRQYITTDRGKQFWDDCMNNSVWDGSLLIYDEDMDENLKYNVLSTAWVLLHAVAPLLYDGQANFLQGGFASARSNPSLQHLLLFGDSNTPNDQQAFQQKKSSGLFQLDTVTASKSKQLPEIDFDSPQLSTKAAPFRSWTIDIMDASPPPKSISPTRVANRRPSVPTLRKLDTHSLPKLSVKTQMSKSANPGSGPKIPWHGTPSPLNLLPPPPSASHLNPSFPSSRNESPSTDAASPRKDSDDNRFPNATPTPSRPSSPHTPMPCTPRTAHQDDEPLTTEDAFPEWTISTILPNFLFLGPEPTTEEHVCELKECGVKRILNIAIECDDDLGLNLRTRFESYVKIPMRDMVEEENIRRGVKEVCNILDDARLHSSATYIHCKAGKSRSVTAVIGYLIHANHWTLTRAYSFVLERRKGISPNIGFVSELMNFEEEELGGKSVGVVNKDLDHQGDNASAVSVGNAAGASRRPTHLRESLPSSFDPRSIAFGGTDGVEPVGDSGQEMEIRDSSGRYRHARRAPVDETTLQHTRRASKAGLESGGQDSWN